MTTAEDYRAHAARCRSLTRWISDGDACDNLKRLAQECDDAACRLEAETRGAEARSVEPRSWSAGLATDKPLA